MAPEDSSTSRREERTSDSEDIPTLAPNDTLSFDDLEPTTAAIGPPLRPPPQIIAPLPDDLEPPTRPASVPVAPGPSNARAAPPSIAPLPGTSERSRPARRGGRTKRQGRRRAEAPLRVAVPEVEPVAEPVPAEPPPHAEIHANARYEYTSLPADDPPLTGVLVEFEAFGQPLVSGKKGPVAHVVLALDLSASMNDPDKYPVLREAVGLMLDDLHADGAADVLLSVVIFSKGADVVLRDTLARRVDRAALFRDIEAHPLCFGRYTDVAGAIGRAGRIAYDQCRRAPALPVRVYVLTDGNPQDMDAAREAAGRLGKIPADVYALAFGADADVGVLQELFAGRRGGAVKSVRKDTIGTAFERVAEVAQRVVATRCIVTVDLALGVVGDEAYRYRPARVRFPDPAFEGGKHFKADLGTIETGRKYQLLFQIRPPEREEAVTNVGRATIRIPGHGGPIAAEVALSLPRTGEGSLPGDVDTEVRTAHDILGALTDDDPQVALRALRLRRELYARERRDPGLIRIIDLAITVLERDGSLDALAPGDLATLRSHTCTASGGDPDLAFLRG